MAHHLSEMLKPRLSHWYAYDESLNPHKFRVAKYVYASSTYYATEYGVVSTRKQGGHTIVIVTPKGREGATIVFNEDEELTDQELLSLLIYWTVKPLFLAVPVSEINQEQAQQELLF